MRFITDVPPPVYVTPELVERAVRHCAASDMLGTDTETLGKHKSEETGQKHTNMNDEIVVMGFSPDDFTRYLVPRALVPHFKPVLEDPALPKAFHNFKFDAHRFLNLGIQVRGPVADGMILDWLYDEDQRENRHGLKDCGRDFFDLPMQDYESLFGKMNPLEISRPGHEVFPKYLDYASLDPWVSRRLAFHHLEALGKMKCWEDSDWSLKDHYWDIECAQLYCLLEMERLGINLNVGHLDYATLQLQEKMEKVAKELCYLVGRPINPSSTKQVPQLLFEEMGLPILKKTKGGAPCCDEEVLTELANQRQVPAARLILEYREAQKLKGTYTEGLIKRLWKDGHVHTTYSPIKVTGRLGSSDPNLQNLPKTDWDPVHTRRAFIPDSEDECLIVGDYCLAAGTGVDGPCGSTPIENLQIGDLVFSYQREKELPRVRKVVGKKFTGVRRTLLVRLDSGTEVRCTPEERWLTLEGDEVLARDLLPGQRLLPLRRGAAGQGHYETIYSHSNRRYRYTHQAAAECVYGMLPPNSHVHHEDDNKRNNHPRNLVILKKAVHLSLHSTENALRQWADPTIRERMREGIKRTLKENGGHHGENNPNFGNRAGVSSTCPTCGEEFYRAPSMKAKFCSAECYYVSKNHRVAEVVFDDVEVPTWDIEIEDDHNFALTAGVFVHNSQLEIRILATASGDQGMIEAIRGGLDMHTYAASKELGIPYEEGKRRKTAEDPEFSATRSGMKAVVFGTVYGAQAGKIASQLAAEFKRPVTKQEGQQRIDAYMNMFPGVRSYILRMHEHARKHGYVQTISGRFRRLSAINSRNFMDRGEAERQAQNSPIQGSAADIVKKAMVHIHMDDYFRSLGWTLRLQVHDELVANGPKETAAEAKAVMKSYMENPFMQDLPVALDVSIKTASNWEEGK